jgi:hypothetical protein
VAVLPEPNQPPAHSSSSSADPIGAPEYAAALHSRPGQTVADKIVTTFAIKI